MRRWPTDSVEELCFVDLLPHLERWGITRVADTTGLDVLATPTASATKPATNDAIWVYSGKGITQDTARVVAVMECLERTAALWPDKPPTVVRPEKDLRDGSMVWGPDRFTESKSTRYDSSQPIAWAAARSYPNGELVWVPAHLVYNGNTPAGFPISPFVSQSSNGLAAHVDADRALGHALLEVIERHSVSVLEVTSSHYSYIKLAGLAEKLGLSPRVLDTFVDNTEAARTIDVSTLPPDLLDIVRRYESAGLVTVVKLLPNSMNMPTYGVAAVEQTGLSEYLGCAGYGSRPTHAAALRSALLELAQTRATDLQGAREDRHETEKQRLLTEPKAHWLASPSTETYAFPHDTDGPAAGDLVAFCSEALANAGFPDWCYAQFDAYEGIHCYRVLVPGLETWHSNAGASDLGPELRMLTGEQS